MELKTSQANLETTNTDAIIVWQFEDGDVSTRAVMISRGREDMDFRGQDAVR